MSSPSPPYPSPPSGRRLIFVALAAAAMTLVVSRRGLFLTPDSWAYWEGSVALVAGEGYRYLGGRAIDAWPPLTSLWLAAWQALLGPTVETLRWAMAFAAGATAASWTRLAARLGARGPAALAASGAFAAAFAARELSWLLSESLTLPLLACALVTLVRDGAEPRRGATVRLAAWLVALLLARHASIVFLPALVVAAPLLAPETERRRMARVTRTAAAAAVALWWSARAALGQLGSHELEEGPLGARLARRLGELASGLAGREGDALAGFGWLLPLALVGAVVLAWRRRDEPAGRAALGLLLVALLSSLLLVPLAATVRIGDPIHGRFLWPVLLLLGTALAALAGRRWPGRSEPRRLVASLLLVAMAAVAVARWGDAAWRFRPRPFDRERGTRPAGLLPPEIRLDAGYVAGPPVERGRWLVVAPPAGLRRSGRPAADEG